MNKEELRKELSKLYDDISDTVFNDKYEIKEAFFRLIRFNEHLIASVDTSEDDIRHVNDKDDYDSEEYFMRSVKSIIDNGGNLNIDILNWYRNFYHTKPINTEQGLIARILDDVFTEMKYKDIKLTSIHNLSVDMLEE